MVTPERSRYLAGLVGPFLIVLASTEATNMSVYEFQTPNVVYLNGTILFAGGLALARGHNVWSRDWRVLITLAGWVGIAAGLYRMILPHSPQLDVSMVTYIVFGVLGLAGAILTYFGYSPAPTAAKEGGTDGRS